MRRSPISCPNEKPLNALSLRTESWGCIPFFVETVCKRIVGIPFKRAGCPWSKAGINALFAIKCCIDGNRRPDRLP